MAAPVFIGDELTAAGYRLAGIRIRTPEPEDVLQTLEWASTDSSLIMITPDYINVLSSDDYNRFLSQETPAVIVVPDIRGATSMEDFARTLRAQLGVLE